MRHIGTFYENVEVGPPTKSNQGPLIKLLYAAVYIKNTDYLLKAVLRTMDIVVSFAFT